MHRKIPDLQVHLRFCNNDLYKIQGLLITQTKLWTKYQLLILLHPLLQLPLWEHLLDQCIKSTLIGQCLGAHIQESSRCLCTP